MLAFRERGMPWSGPRSHWPLWPRGAKSSRSAFRAWARASSAVTVRYALSLGLSFSMRASMSLVSSTGESLRLRKSFPISLMEAKARSASFIGATLNHTRRCHARASRYKCQPSKDFFLVAKIPEGADIGDDEGDSELILRAHLAEGDAAVFDGQAATGAAVAELRQLILQGVCGQVVTDACGRAESFTVEIAIAEKCPDLIGERLQDGIGLHAEMGDGSEEFAVGPYFQKSADGGDFVEVGVVLEDLLGIVPASRSDPEIADDGRPVDGPGGESKGCDGIERLKYVAHASPRCGRRDAAITWNDCAAERGIKEMFLQDAPGNEFLRLVFFFLQKQPLRESVLDFIGVRECGVGIETDEVGEIIHPGDVAVGNGRFDGVLVPPSRPVFFRGTPLEEALETGRAKVDAELAGIAQEGNAADQTGGIERIAVAGRTESGGGSDTEPGTEVHRDGDAQSKLRAGHVAWRMDWRERWRGRHRVGAMGGASKTVEREIERRTLPRRLFDGTETRLRQIAESDAGGRYGRSRGSCRYRQRQKTLVVQAREIEAEATEIVGEEDGAAHFRVDGFAEGVGEGQAEGKRGEVVVVRDEAPASGKQGLDFEALLLAALRITGAARVDKTAVVNAEEGVLDRSVLKRLGAK